MNQQPKLPRTTRPPVSILIIVICVGVYLLNNISAQLALWPLYSGYFQPWQLLSYAFLHGSFNDLFFNMFALWMFGSVLENVWGPKKFLIYYVVTGVGAALVHYVVFYFEIQPILSGINNFLMNPNLDQLDIFINAHKFHIHQGSGDIWSQFQQFKQDVSNLTIDKTNSQALQGTVLASQLFGSDQ